MIILKEWRLYTTEGFTQCAQGRVYDHPDQVRHPNGKTIRTSVLVEVDAGTGCIKTIKGHWYKLVGPPALKYFPRKELSESEILFREQLILAAWNNMKSEKSAN